MLHPDDRIQISLNYRGNGPGGWQPRLFMATVIKVHRATIDVQRDGWERIERIPITAVVKETTS